MELGAQYYTLREYTKTPKDLLETLKKTADIGYKTVQISGTCPYTGEWLADALKETGLRCVITHYSPEKIKDDPRFVADEHKKFGCRYIGLGSMPLGGKTMPEAVGGFIENFLPAAKALKECGEYLMYHNHSSEFMTLQSGQRIIERLAEAFPKELMGFTLDTYWVQAAGGDPAYWIKKLSGRVPCIHLKDMGLNSDAKAEMRPVGYGNINFETVLSAAESAGTEYLLVEQDDCQGEDPFDCLKKSYDYLKSLGLK